jgi:MarR family transcriptional regulator, organic hydroperoxide resistance regulator
VLEAVHAVTEAGRPASINDIARELGLDQSGASRMVAHAENEGLVTRSPRTRVGRPTTIAATAAGRQLLQDARTWQDEVLATLTADWPPDDVETLTTLMARLVQAQSTKDATPQPPTPPT